MAPVRLRWLLYREGRRMMSQISDDLGIWVSAVTQMTDRQEKADMVTHVTEPEGDQRTRYLVLTSHGESMLQSWHPWRLNRIVELLGTMTETQRTAARNALNLLESASHLLPPAPGTLKPPL